MKRKVVGKSQTGNRLETEHCDALGFGTMIIYSSDHAVESM